MKVLKGMVSFVPLVVWKRLHRRSTRTMMTTQRSTVLPVEFKDVPPRGHGMLPPCHSIRGLTYEGAENSWGRLGRSGHGIAKLRSPNAELRNGSRSARSWLGSPVS